MDLRPFARNWRTSDPERYARNAKIIATEPALGLGSPTIDWTNAALNAMQDFSDAAYPRRIRERLLIVAAGRDNITSAAASETFASRSSASHFVIADAKHELLMEQDRYQRQFWSAFDSFVG